MRFPSLRKIEPGFWLSGAAHAALLGAGLVAFTSAPLPDAVEGIPVEVITDNQFSEITKGEVTAKKVQPTPSPRVDRQAETRVERDPGEAKQDAPAPPRRPADMKVADEEVAPAAAAAAPPPSRAEAVKAAAAKAATEAAAKQEAVKLAQREEAEILAREEKAALAEKARSDAQAKAKADAQAKARQEADAKAKADLDARTKALADAESKAQAEADAKAKADAQAKAKAVADAKQKAKTEADAKAKKQAELADKFDPGSISKMLASREPAQSSGSTGREVQKTASLGTASGNAQRLNPSQRDQIAGIIREQLIRCWQPPVAVTSSAKPPTAVIRLAIRQDGSLMADPAVTNSSSDPLFRPVADSALRAARRCAPLRIPAQFAPFYQDWKDLVVDFDPREMG